MTELINKATEFGIKAHDRVGQDYEDGVLNYDFHLNFVALVGGFFIEDATNSGFNYEEIVACFYLHDTTEDCWHVNYNAIKENFGYEIAEIVFALQENKGRNRKERHDADYYRGVVGNLRALFVKLTDITANSLYSLHTGNKSMFNKYKTEFSDFSTYFSPDEFPKITRFLHELYWTAEVPDAWKEILDRMIVKHKAEYRTRRIGSE